MRRIGHLIYAAVCGWRAWAWEGRRGSNSLGVDCGRAWEGRRGTVGRIFQSFHLGVGFDLSPPHHVGTIACYIGRYATYDTKTILTFWGKNLLKL